MKVVCLVLVDSVKCKHCQVKRSGGHSASIAK